MAMTMTRILESLVIALILVFVTSPQLAGYLKSLFFTLSYF